MNRTMRLITMVGMGLAGLTIGATPAMAADGAGAGQATAKALTAKPYSAKVQHHRDREWIAGYYRSLRTCELVGRIGERFDRWDDYDCKRVRWGFRRGTWALEVEKDFGWHRPGHRPGGVGHGPWGQGHGPWGAGQGHRGHGPRGHR